MNNQVYCLVQRVGTRKTHSFQPLLSDNIRWSTYTSPHSHQKFDVAEIADTDGILDEAIKYNLPEPFGIFTWDSSYLAADFLDTFMGKELTGKVVCDLGCGTGLTSLICMYHGAHVISMDNNSVSLSLCKLSHDAYMQTRSSEGTMVTTLFDLECSNSRLPCCDLLIVSDLLYYEHLAHKVAERIYEALTNWPCTVLVTDPGRLSAAILIDVLSNKLQNTKYESQLWFAPFIVDDATKGNYMVLK